MNFASERSALQLGYLGCGDLGGDSELGARFCYTHPTCALATPSLNFPGAAWRACEMEEDEDIERVFKCVAVVPVAKVVVPALATPRNDTKTVTRNQPIARHSTSKTPH